MLRSAPATFSPVPASSGSRPVFPFSPLCSCSSGPCSSSERCLACLGFVLRWRGWFCTGGGGGGDFAQIFSLLLLSLLYLLLPDLSYGLCGSDWVAHDLIGSVSVRSGSCGLGVVVVRFDGVVVAGDADMVVDYWC